MTSLALLVALCQQKDTVTLTKGIAAAGEVVKALAENTGETLLTEGPIAFEPLLVRLKDVPKDEALERVAKVLDGVWRTEGGKKILARRPGYEAEQENVRIEAIAAQIRKKITESDIAQELTREGAEKAVKAAIAAQELPEETRWSAVMAADARSARKRLIMRIVKSVGVERLAKLRSGEQLVLSSHPTPRQEALPKDFQAAVQSYLNERAMLRDALGQSTFSNAVGGYYSEILQEDDAGVTPTYFLFKFSRNAMGGFLDLKYTLSSDDWSTQSNEMFGIEAPGSDQATTIKLPDVKAELQLSERAQNIVTAMKQAMSQRGRSSKPEEPTDYQKALLGYFKEMDKDDPFAWIPSETLLAAAEAVDVNLVARLDDAMILMSNYMLADQKDAIAGTRALLSFSKPSFEQSDDWWVISPPKANPYNFFVVPRVAVAKFARKYEKEGANVDTLADFAQASGSKEAFNFGCQVLGLALPGLSGFDWSGYDALSIYGALDANSRAAAKRGEFRFKYGTVKNALTKRVDEWIQDSTVNPVSGDHSEVDFKFQQAVQRTGGEPTSLFPYGIPSNSEITVSLKLGDKQYMELEYEGGYRQTMAADKETIASYLWSSEGNEYIRTLRFFRGEQTLLTVLLSTPEKLGSSAVFELKPPMPESTPTGLDGLDAETRRAVEEKVAEYRKQRGTMRMTPQQDQGRRIKP
ncbi:MAG: hypothetical protein KIT11_05110 [Fimbriimonadaceae bacterium]|nr:hypothetical protein [Fimbriimonadaceae bacterium]QYK56727.1 MAG: hypothetical protein KF733_04410 [Fimbriimonadaceae bacterium]